MTDQVSTERDLKRIIEDDLGADRVFSTSATPYRDHADEPALSIAVTMKSAADIPDARRQSALTRALRQALAERDDARFPYLYFDALDIDRTSEDADEFEPWPKDSEQL